MPTTSLKQTRKENNVINVSTINSGNSGSTALVVVDDMSDKEILDLHTSVKKAGRGAIREFVQNETPYNTYGDYYYRLVKKGVAPFKPREEEHKSTPKTSLEARIEQLERELSFVQTTPAVRAMNILSENLEEVTGRSRKFLCDVVYHDRNHLTEKQNKWLSDLEDCFSEQ